MSKKDFQLIQKREEPEFTPEGTENAICMVVFSSIGEVFVSKIFNPNTTYPYYLENMQDYMQEIDEQPGIYLIEYSVEGDRDYWGEYDSWPVFHRFLKYNISIMDKRNHFNNDLYEKSWDTKTYNEEIGSEYPRCLLAVTEDGYCNIIDVINEDIAYKSIIKEAYYLMEKINIIPGVYMATLSIVGDMVNLLDRDENENVKLEDIEKLEILLENISDEDEEWFKEQKQKEESFTQKLEKWQKEEEKRLEQQTKEQMEHDIWIET